MTTWAVLIIHKWPIIQLQSASGAFIMSHSPPLTHPDTTTAFTMLEHLGRLLAVTW